MKWLAYILCVLGYLSAAGNLAFAAVGYWANLPYGILNLFLAGWLTYLLLHWKD